MSSIKTGAQCTEPPTVGVDLKARGLGFEVFRV